MRDRVVFLRVGPLDVAVGDDAIAAEAAEVVERMPASVRVRVEKRLHAGEQPLDYVRPDRMIQHGRGAHLRGTAAEQEIIERVRKIRDAANPREAPLREGRG